MGKSEVPFSLMAKIRFYLAYVFYKLLVLFEVKRPKWKMFRYEMVYSFRKLKDYHDCYPFPYDVDKITTRFGKFTVRKCTADAANVSPAFERLDVNFLLRLIKKLVRQGKRVLFLDIGGDLGTYSVTVGNRFAGRGVDVVCFEPVPDSVELIRQNLRDNGLENQVRLQPYALTDKDGVELDFYLNQKAPGSSTLQCEAEDKKELIKVKGRTFDALMKNSLQDYDTVIVKIDVEGWEIPVLNGAKQLVRPAQDVYLMVEDFIDPAIVSYLKENNARFIAKKTTYNSWWKFESQK